MLKVVRAFAIALLAVLPWVGQAVTYFVGEQGTLQQVLAKAKSDTGDVKIRIPAGQHEIAGTIELKQADTVKFIGAGKDKTIITAAGADCNFVGTTKNKESNLYFYDLEFRGVTTTKDVLFDYVHCAERVRFWSVQGKDHILSSHDWNTKLILDSCDFSNCRVGTSVADGEYMVVKNTSFEQCEGSEYGGCFKNVKHLELSDCTFNRCSVKKNGGVAESCGKGSWKDGKMMKVANCTFSNCSAGEDGGAFDNCANQSFHGTTFKNCKAGNYGGAVDTSTEEQSIFVRCSFISCEATKDSGGAVYCDDKKTAFFNCLFYDCKAYKKGGSISFTSDARKGPFGAYNCTFIGCSTTTTEAGDAGGVYGISCMNCIFFNTTRAGKGTSLAFTQCSENTEDYGKSVFRDFDDMDFRLDYHNASAREKLIDKGIPVTDNILTNTWTSATEPDRTNFLFRVGVNHISDLTDRDNRSRTVGTTVDIGCYEYRAQGDDLVVTGASGFTLTEVLNLANNYCDDSDPTVSFNLPANNKIDISSMLTISKKMKFDGSNNGRRVHLNWTVSNAHCFQLQNSRHMFNNFDFTGNGILSQESGDLVVSNCTFTGCKNVEHGSAIFSYKNGLSVYNCLFNDCSTTKGGVVFLKDTTSCVIRQTTFSGCKTGSDQNGAALLSQSGSLNKFIVDGSSCVGCAGNTAMYLYNDTANHMRLISRSTFANNKVPAGAVYNGTSGGNLKIVSSFFGGNVDAAGNCGKDIGGNNIDCRHTVSSHDLTSGSSDSKVPEDELPYQFSDKMVYSGTYDSIAHTTAQPREYSRAHWDDVWGCYIWHDADWNNVAESSTRDGEKTALCGNAGSATTCELMDLFGNAINNKYAPVGCLWFGKTMLELAHVHLVSDYTRTQTNQTKNLTYIPGSQIAKTTPAARAGTTFQGWFAEKYGHGRQWSDAQGNFTLVCQPGHTYLFAFYEGVYTIIFRNMFEVQNGEVKAAKGDPLPTPPVPEKDGCTFLGWYTEEYGGGERWYLPSGASALDPDAYPYEKDFRLYAYWDTGIVPISPGVTTVVGNGETKVVENVKLTHQASGPYYDVQSGGTLILRNVEFVGDGYSISERRSAIHNAGAVICSNCTFTSLVAPYAHGAAYSDAPGAVGRFVNCSFVDNEAMEGGAVASEGGKASFLNCTIGANRSYRADLDEEQKGGAAVYASGGGSLAFGGCTIVTNRAASVKEGAGIYVRGATLSFYDSVVQGNGPKYEFFCESSGKVGFRSSRYGTSASDTDALASLGSTAVDAVGQPRTEKTGKVTQTVYPAWENARTGGKRLWISADGLSFAASDSQPSGYTEVFSDIIGEPPYAGYIGARRANVLQALIDAAAAGSTLTVNARTYDPVKINKALTLLGATGASIDAGGHGSCVTVGGKPVFLAGFTLANGFAAGGGVNVTAANGATVVSNCTFSACCAPSDSTSGQGGGVLRVNDVQDCTFRNCSAYNGGGAALIDRIVDSLFYECSATHFGGGVWGVKATVDDTKFESCTAYEGGGAFGGTKNDETEYSGIFSDCEFTENVAKDVGGGLACAMKASASSFNKNEAAYGGGAALVDIIMTSAFTRNGAATAGGGAYSVQAVTDGTFTDNTAGNGGGVFGVVSSDGVIRTSLNHCTFEKNSATAINAYGGGAALAKSFGCVFERNSSLGSAGGLQGEASATLFNRNEAVSSGGAMEGTAYSCTFARNRTNGQSGSSDAALTKLSTCYDSLFYENELPEIVGDTQTKVARKNYFIDADRDNYRLNDQEPETKRECEGTESGAAKAFGAKWTDPDGAALYNEINGRKYFYLGCYAFLPFSVGGVTVNAAGDAYEDTNLKTSFREAIANAQADPEAYATDGKVRILFNESVFDKKGCLRLDLAKAGMALTAFTKYPLVIEAPEGKSVTICGAGQFRPFYVAAGNRLELKNVTLEDCVGGPHKTGSTTLGTDGGAVMNKGTLIAEGCAFRNCKGGKNPKAASIVYPDSPTGYGGALWTGGGATSVVTRCTFDGCAAAAGGAVYNDNKSFTTFLLSTFAGNRAMIGGATLSGNGGAVFQNGPDSDSAFVNCTIANNVADVGAGIYAAGQYGSKEPIARFLNTILVGNVAQGKTEDVFTTGPVRLEHCAYGTIPNPVENIRIVSTTNGVAPADLFSKTDEKGGAVVSSETVDGVTHKFYVLRSDAGTDGAYAWSDTFGKNIAWGETSSSARTTLRGNLALARKGIRQTTDQLGGNLSSPPRMGAVNRAEGKTDPDLPDPSEPDPLVVTDTNPLSAALAYASKNLSAADADGVVTIAFDPSYSNATYALDAEAEVALFADRTLRIEGNFVTLDCLNAGRAFHVCEGNSLQLRNLTIANGVAEVYGGGVYAEDDVSLYASNVTFRSCQVVYPSYESVPLAAGGAVALCGSGCWALFWHCTFDGCSAEDFGGAVYRETTAIEIHRCTFTGNVASDEFEDEWDISWAMRAKVEHPDGTEDLYDETSDAVNGDLSAGDTLVVLDSDAQAPENFTIPPGVSVRDDSGGATAFLAAAKVAMTSALKTAKVNWYDVKETTGAVSLVLNEEAVPTLDENATVDLSSDADVASVMPSNVKPGLLYGLGYSETPGGEYKVDTWVRANDDGTLPASLTAPKTGGSGFYKVIVK